MTYKDELLEKLRRNTHEQYPMPDTPIDGISYDDTVKQFVDMSMSVGSKVVMAKPNEKLDDIVRNAYPEAKTIASNIAELTIATINPDTVAEAQDLNGTDVGVVYGQIGVAENGQGEHQRLSPIQHIDFLPLGFGKGVGTPYRIASKENAQADDDQGKEAYLPETCFDIL